MFAHLPLFLCVSMALFVAAAGDMFSADPETTYPDCLYAGDLNQSMYLDSAAIQDALKLCLTRAKDPLM